MNSKQAMSPKPVTPYFLESVEPTVGQLILIAEHCGLELTSSLSDELAARHSLLGETILTAEIEDPNNHDFILSDEVKDTSNIDILDAGLGFAVGVTAFVLINKSVSGVKRSDYLMSEPKKSDFAEKISADVGESIVLGRAVTVTARQIVMMLKSLGLEFKPGNDAGANTRVTISSHPSTPFRGEPDDDYQLIAIVHSDKFTKDSFIKI